MEAAALAGSHKHTWQLQCCGSSCTFCSPISPRSPRRMQWCHCAPLGMWHPDRRLLPKSMGQWADTFHTHIHMNICTIHTHNTYFLWIFADALICMDFKNICVKHKLSFEFHFPWTFQCPLAFENQSSQRTAAYFQAWREGSPKKWPTNSYSHSFSKDCTLYSVVLFLRLLWTEAVPHIGSFSMTLTGILYHACQFELTGCSLHGLRLCVQKR